MGHNQAASGQCELTPEEMSKVRQFDRDLHSAMVTYKTSNDAEKKQRYLAQVYSIGFQAHGLVAALNHPNRDRALEGYRLDLAGLTEELNDIR